jgi:class 3 adenylate cyclase
MSAPQVVNRERRRVLCPRFMNVERRLAAILAADLVGYSRLMGADETGTVAALKKVRRDVTDPCIITHQGRLVKTTGDGVLVEFASVVQAVQCAAAIQAAMCDSNAGGSGRAAAAVPGRDQHRRRDRRRRRHPLRADSPHKAIARMLTGSGLVGPPGRRTRWRSLSF